MGVWLDEAKMAAARRAGRRYWKWLIVAHLLRICAPGLRALTAAVIVLTGAAVAWNTATGAITWPHLPTGGNTDWPALLRVAALAAALVWVGWTGRDLLTGAAIRRRHTGQRQPAPALALGAAAALLIASLLIR